MKTIKISGVLGLLGVLVICAPLQAQTIPVHSGITTVNSSGNVTTVTPNGANGTNGYTVISNGSSGYTVIEPCGVRVQVLPLGNEGLFLIER